MPLFGIFQPFAPFYRDLHKKGAKDPPEILNLPVCLGTSYSSYHIIYFYTTPPPKKKKSWVEVCPTTHRSHAWSVNPVLFKNKN